MKNKLMLGMAVWMIVGQGFADPLPRMAEWAGKRPLEKNREELKKHGLPEEEDQNLVLSGWDESTVVDVSLKNDSLLLLTRAARLDGLRDSSVQRILAHEQAKPAPSHAIWALYFFLPREQQRGFEPLVRKLIEERYKEKPVEADLARKYGLGMGRDSVHKDSEAKDLVRLLLAPEPLSLYRTDVLRKILKEQAVRLAKRKLRDEGGTFVVQEDGVNPLLEKVKPVVDALNAPMAAGLEAALRDLGADVPEQERSDLAAWVAEWKEKVLYGEVPQSSDLLGKLSVGLGVEGFNAFVDAYNRGEDGRDETP
jgi:hypothetical protein